MKSFGDKDRFEDLYRLRSGEGGVIPDCLQSVEGGSSFS